MKRKGFTLIELLAVIVVLAIIALIATPIVLNLITKARIGAAEQSVTGYVKAIENTIMKDMLKQEPVQDGNYKYNSLKADISGKRPTNGKYTVKNGKVESGNFCVDEYYIEYKNGTSKYNKEKKCSDSSSSTSIGVTKVEPTSTDTHKGIVYLDPTNLENVCNASNSKSETETKQGCMKWYIYYEDDNNYKMLLDHNTTVEVAWNSTGNNIEMKEAKTALENDTKNWNNSLQVRLITASEIAEITNNTNFNIDDSGSWFYLDSNSHTQMANSVNKSKYAWLYDYTYNCESYGCSVEDSKVNGYWTSSAVSGSIIAWRVFGDGSLQYYPVSSPIYGIRPVITVPKNIIK